ncbi:MAG: GIY-YIG nuclease family protein [Arenicellales bacterium WSBS_2016_MAG_OTU3]
MKKSFIELHRLNETIADTIRLEKKYVYIISNSNYKGEYKVGIAKDWKLRLNNYQTGDPDRDYICEFHYLTPCYREIEKEFMINLKINMNGCELS